MNGLQALSGGTWHDFCPIDVRATIPSPVPSKEAKKAFMQDFKLVRNSTDMDQYHAWFFTQSKAKQKAIEVKMVLFLDEYAVNDRLEAPDNIRIKTRQVEKTLKRPTRGRRNR